MSETLIAVLHGVRRRLRLRRALDAAVLGGTVALAVVAGLAALQLGRPADAVGAATWAALAGWQRMGLLLAAAVLGGILGALLAIARRPEGELAAAATAVDRWLERSGARGDRARVALALGHSPSPFARAAVADAVERAAGVPVREAAPLRRPRWLGALTVAGACGLVAALAPAIAPMAATGRRARAVVPTGDSGRALAEVEGIGREARARGDDDLAALADELAGWLTKQRDAPAAAEELAALAARARRAAEEGAQAAEVLARVAAALAGTDASRALGQAFARMDPAAIAREARAAGAAGSPDALAGALARAAAAAARNDEAEPRRLSGLEPEPTPAPGRPGAANPAAAGGAPATPERRLQRLERDLRESADACAADPSRCGPELDARADNLAAPARDAAGVEGRERLARTMEGLRGGGGEARTGERSGSPGGRPAQARSGGTGRPGQTMLPGGAPPTAGGAGQVPAGGNAQGEASAGSAAQGEAAATRSDEEAAAARQAFEQAARGDGAGAQGAEGPGGAGAAGAGTGAGSGSGNATGAEPPPTAPAGPRVELSIPEGAGPTRAEAIRTGAGRGFAQPGYAPVFRDYQAAVEDGLERTDVPAERRQLVRRYFELIRPR